MCVSIPFAALTLAEQVRLADGRIARIRAIALEDAEAVQRFIRGLSIGSARRRFFRPVRELSPRLLAAVVDVDSVSSLSLVAEANGEIVALAQYIAETESTAAEVALVVADAWQLQGLGRELFGTLVWHATNMGIARLCGDVLADNSEMLALLHRYGFNTRANSTERGVLRVERELGGPWPANAHELESALWDMRPMIPVATATSIHPANPASADLRIA
jgi:acetyltransferase